MNSTGTERRIRPGLVALVVCILAAVLVPFGLSLVHRGKPTTDAGGEAPPVPATPAAPRAPATAAADPAPPTPSLGPALEEKWGIQVSNLRLGMGNSVVDLRYKVVAPEKAALLTRDSHTVYLIDQASGAKIQMLGRPQEGTWSTNVRPRTAARMLHQAGEFPPTPNRLVAGKIYSLLLPNAGGTVKSGSKVALVVGDLRLENLIVE